MKKTRTFLKPGREADIRFTEFYEEISSNWRDKATRLQERRWQKLKHRLV